MKLALKTLAVGVFVLGLSGRTAVAAVIDFNTLPGADLAAFTTYTENNFTVSATSGQWFNALSYGNPTPDIFLGPLNVISSGSITVTFGGGLFSFASVDFSSNFGTSDYSVQGYQGGSLQFTQAGTQAINCPPCIFSTVSSASALAVDTLVLGFTPGNGTTSFNVDNIVVNAATSSVPEPATFGLVCLAGLLGGVAQLKRARRS